ncbi:hypothetical protein SALWKB2_1886 [Snodgrassella alvi wkB2]|uniref:Uncharacterized protein n=1 Tax=Snodgrassella alvi TaxID=1196083 RepID=A0ABD7Z1F6_9NEIS|nr:hypothetical protein [Snodgrassella alvi]AHN29268.1 hypothetical protein SALWKB2_1886 [Snodgrassella alvi wkB2]PIT44512.1 hypothetical protein BHC45_06435 [Snodgrassella alvi]UOO97713.1 hypothetical protein LVJ87_06445 [Snodgrassella alvi wkB2]WLS98343.1 hypothetical protein RAM05_10955 [Snodgrassella alvi]
MTKKFKSLKNAPKIGQTYYLLTPDGGSCFYMELTWEGEINEYHWLKSHRVYATEKAVKRAAKFIKRFITSHKEQLKYLTSEPQPGTIVWYGIDMDGDTEDSVSTPFIPNDGEHQLLLKRGLLYNNSDMVKEASKIITKALAMEYKRLKYKFLTEIPKPGTIVYYPHFGFESGVDELEWHPNFSAHVRYLKLGLLFSKKKHALRAGRAMLKQINSTIPK